MANPPREYQEPGEKSFFEKDGGLAVNVKVTSFQRELMSMESLFNSAVESLAEIYGIDLDDDGDTDDIFLTDSENVTVTAEGSLQILDGRLEISYTEIFDDGYDECDTTVSFDMSDPSAVTITRSGDIRSALVIEKGKRHICAYETPYMPLEVCVIAKNVVNEMTLAGGRILLDYAVEIKGAATQISRVEIYVTPCEI